MILIYNQKATLEDARDGYLDCTLGIEGGSAL